MVQEHSRHGQDTPGPMIDRGTWMAMWPLCVPRRSFVVWTGTVVSYSLCHSILALLEIWSMTSPCRVQSRYWTMLLDSFRQVISPWSIRRCAAIGYNFSEWALEYLPVTWTDKSRSWHILPLRFPPNTWTHLYNHRFTRWRLMLSKHSRETVIDIASRSKE